MRRVTFAEMRELPRPTAEERERFVHHVRHVHSWYRHSPLEGTEIVVFVSRDAGMFTGWVPRPSQSEIYRARFGYLDYQWRHVGGAGEWSRDGETVLLPEELHPKCYCTLHPWCSSGVNAIEVILARWGSRPSRKRSRREEEEAALAQTPRLLAIEDAYLETDSAYAELTEQELDRYRPGPPQPDESERVHRLRALEARTQSLYEEWQAPELEGIIDALDALDRLLE